MYNLSINITSLKFYKFNLCPFLMTSIESDCISDTLSLRINLFGIQQCQVASATQLRTLISYEAFIERREIFHFLEPSKSA